VLHPVEQYLVDVVTDVARTDLGIDWGPWCRRDARDDSGLRVDLTFEPSNIALELTSLQDGDWNAVVHPARSSPEAIVWFARRGDVDWQLMASVQEPTRA